MGWNFAHQLSKKYEVHLLVEEGEFRETLTRYAEENPEEVKHMHFHYVRRHHHETLRSIYPPSYYWFYRKWHREALKLAIELDKKENFDLVHQVTISGFREPGFLWKLGKPYIWGPLGGLTDAPWCLLSSLGWKGAFHFGVRNIINAFQKRWGRHARAAAAHSHTILTSTTMAQKEIKDFWKRDAILMNEVGYEDRHSPQTPAVHEEGTPLRICWAGEHIPRKALDLLLKALTQTTQPMELHVLSKGPRTMAWKKLTQDLGLSDKVTFHGFVARDEAFRIMGSCHVFCITSIREDTSTVVFEAFRYGMPIIALDHCGFATVINESCGIKIPIQSKKQVIADYARHLDYLATHEEQRQQLSVGALSRCADFTWENKVETLCQIYKEALEQGCAR